MMRVSADQASSVEGVVLVELASVRMSAEGCQCCPLARTRDKVVFGLVASPQVTSLREGPLKTLSHWERTVPETH